MMLRHYLQYLFFRDMAQAAMLWLSRSKYFAGWRARSFRDGNFPDRLLHVAARAAGCEIAHRRASSSRMATMAARRRLGDCREQAVAAYQAMAGQLVENAPI